LSFFSDEELGRLGEYTTPKSAVERSTIQHEVTIVRDASTGCWRFGAALQG
jgi:hypothetical protein